MGDKVSEETKSPYSEPLPRPHSARESPRPSSEAPSKEGSKTSTQQRSKSAKSPSRTGSSNKKKKGKKKHVDENEKEIQLVSREVRKKLELYLNREKRETRFRPEGAITTTRKMAPFDIAYRLMEYENMEKKSPRFPKSKQQTDKNKQNKCVKDPYTIEPILVQNSRRVTQYAEADRYSKYASEVFASYPIEQLAVIHRYRPHPKDHKKGAENGNVIGYTGHVGAALHQKAYVDFYIKEGFDSKHHSNESHKSKSSKTTESNDSRDKNQRKTSNSSTSSTRSGTNNRKLEPIEKPKKANSKPEENNKNVTKQQNSGETQKGGKENKTSKQSANTKHKQQAPVPKSEKGQSDIQDDIMNGNEKDTDQPSSETNKKSSDEQRSVTSSRASQKSGTVNAHSSYLSTSSEEDIGDDTDSHKRNKKRKPKSQNSVGNQDLTNKSKESLNKTWDYYEQKKKEPDSEEEIQQDNDRNKTDASDNSRKEDYNDKADENHNGNGSPGKSEVGKTDGDNKSMRSYVSVEHVLQVDIADI